MKQLKDIPAGYKYALLVQKETGKISPLFAGEAGVIADDFILAGVLISALGEGKTVGIQVNKTQDPNFLAKVRAIK